MSERLEWEIERLKERVAENKAEAAFNAAKIHSELEKKIDLLKADVTDDINSLRGESMSQFLELKEQGKITQNIIAEASGFGKATRILGGVLAFVITCALGYLKSTGKL